MIVEKNIVSVASEEDNISYPRTPPFPPNESYPELSGCVSDKGERNIVYPLLREVMLNLGLDKDNYGTASWNPLGAIIKPGMEVLVKPNLVRHLHIGGGDYETVVTHSSLVRSVLDYVGLALEGNGSITVGDAPIQGADFNQILRKTHLREICDDISERWKVPVWLVDFRLTLAEMEGNHTVVGRKSLSGDDRGYQTVNLGVDSLLMPVIEEAKRFRVTCYDCEDMIKHHNAGANEYLIPQTVLDADVVINLPKLKTHRKVGMTTALKNLVGINGYKDWLPHHRVGSKIGGGGDEYLHPSLLKRIRSYLDEEIYNSKWPMKTTLYNFLIRIVSKMIHMFSKDSFEEGSWYGNDTIWRTVLDLNRLLLFADKKGVMQKKTQREVLTFVDAIWAGEGEGPMEPDTRRCGFVAGGRSSVTVDAVLATMIGFDYKKIPLVVNGFNNMEWPLVDFLPKEIKVISNDERWNNIIVGSNCDSLCFKPSSGWLNHIELEK